MWNVHFSAENEGNFPHKHYDRIAMNSSSRKLFNLQATWHEALEFCSKLRMRLLTIFSLDKQTCMFDVFSEGKLDT
jgi:hypothetical protein